MAASSSTIPPNLDTTTPLPPDQFKLFHNIDRILFTRLICNLARHPAEAIRVVAFCLWLEHSGQSRLLIDNMLKWHDAQVIVLYDEAIMCLNCMENDAFPIPCLENYFLRHHIPLVQAITKNTLNLMFFHENRDGVLLGVTNIVNDICARAFEDIVARYNQGLMNPGVYSNYGSDIFNPDAYGTKHNGAGPSRNVEDNIGEKMENMNISGGDQKIEKEGSSVEDRTIFLTFSRGYPISEQEIREFFTRKFGECIEGIFMQDVTSESEQRLFARLVVNHASAIDVILNGKKKTKFSVNGKHVRARRFV